MCGSFAVVTRGIVRAGDAVKAVANQFTDIDSAIPALERIHDDIARAKRDGDDILNIDTTVMGFSKEIDDFAVYRWEMKESKTSMTLTSLARGMHLAPGFPGTKNPSLPLVLSDEQIAKIALAQHTTSKKMDYNMCIGGEMHLTDITKSGIVQRTIGQYPDFAEMRDNIPTMYED